MNKAECLIADIETPIQAGAGMTYGHSDNASHPGFPVLTKGYHVAF